jgi:hypothetical protein
MDTDKQPETAPTPHEVFAFVVGGAIVEAGSYYMCKKRAWDSELAVEDHVFRYVLQGPVQ